MGYVPLLNMTWLKENWFWVGLLTIFVLSVAGAFYWYEWRPMQIRKGCSQIEKQTAARPEVTQVDIDQAKIDVAAMHKNQLISAAEFMLTILAAESPHPAVPSRTYYQEASPAEYNVCLHSHGL